MYVQPSGGKKEDKNKDRWDLLPYEALEQIVKVMTFGANKYGDNNWKLVDENRFVAAMMRHLAKMLAGKEIDEDSGLPAAAHLACNALFILWKRMHK